MEKFKDLLMNIYIFVMKNMLQILLLLIVFFLAYISFAVKFNALKSIL